MKKDPTSGKFWLELTGLTSVNYTYQYWVGETTQLLIPRIGKTSDPLRWFYHLMMMEVFQLS
jgi:hypothetical protein